MTLAEIASAAGRTGLGLVGAFHPEPGDGAPDGVRTLVLLGPADMAMWAVFRGSTEAQDGMPDPLDRWSRRVIGDLAQALGAVALFPFGGPPWHPFQRWAARGEGAVISPVGMQATSRRGLWASYRGALGFSRRLPLRVFRHETLADPCLGCPAPCIDACPVGAFDGANYAVPVCVAHVASASGAACLDGCLVRASCPAGAGMNLPTEQRRFHMAAFLRAQAPRLSTGGV
jgi:epoxyqueuosine reductase